MNRELWPHQSQALEAVEDTLKNGVRRLVLKAPTGSGKTLMAAALIERETDKGNRVVFVVSSISLVDQTVEALYAEGLRDIGVIQANHHLTDWGRPVTVASIQTIRARKAYPQANLVIIDECHVLHESHKEWLNHEGWKAVPFIGLSATPYTRGLGKQFETMITVATVQEMIDKGVLSKFRVFATGHPDLSKVKTVAGDYHEGQASAAMQEGTLNADIVKTYQKHWGKGKTLCFAVDCAHAQALQARFLEAGISCGYQDAHTKMQAYEALDGTWMEGREDIKRKFHSGEFEVVTNVGTLTTGVDWDVRCLILARPTRSEMLYQQIVGRALRTAPDKEYALILDHSNTTQDLGFVTDIHHDELDMGTPGRKKEPKKPLPKECPMCTALRSPGIRKCPVCGFEPKPFSAIVESDGELQEVKWRAPPPPKAPVYVASGDEKRQFLCELKRYCLDKQYKIGWVAVKYKAKFGEFPKFGLVDALRPADQVSFKTGQWIKSQAIAWAKSPAR